MNSTNQHVQCPSPAPGSSGPLKNYYFASRDFLRGNFFFSGNTTSTAPKSLVPGKISCGDNGANYYLAMTNKRPMGQFGQDATFTPLLLMSNILNVCYTLFVNNDLCNVFLIMYNL